MQLQLLMQKKVYMIKKFNKYVCLLPFLMLSGCASIGGLMEKPNIEVKSKFSNEDVFKQEKIDSLNNWWGQFEDPTLMKIIENAQINSPTISSAVLNIKSYELSLGLNRATELPRVGLGGSMSRGQSSIGGEISNYGSIGLQTSWEIDLFNKFGTEKRMNQKKLQGAKAQWHDAQTLVSASAAKSYFSYKLCKEVLDNLQEDYSSRIKQQEITKLNVKVGLESKSSEYLAEARISQAKTSLVNKETECESEIKGLVALTGINEEELKQMLNQKQAMKLDFKIPKMVPGDLIEQRPDVYAAKKNLQALYDNLSLANKQRLPSISINGNISSSYVASGGFSTNGTTWSVGPLSINLPIFDNGRIKANETFASDQIENQKVIFSNNVRQAVKEVEIALLNLSKIEEKSNLIELSVDNYEKLYDATLKKYEVGLSNLYELEDAKISYLNAKNQKVSNKKEILNYWIDLYKAVGGGFKGNENEK